MFTHWFHRSKKPTAHKHMPFKPTVCLLEDRTVPTGLHLGSIFTAPTPGPATTLEVEAPQNVRVGQSFIVEVEAKDANHHIATGYTGTVHFTLTTADTNAIIPVNYQFTASDRGEHFFTFTLSAIGSQTITATDTTTASITGSDTLTVNAAPAATHFRIISPQYVTAGVPVTVTVVALDANNHVATGYTGTVHFTTSDPNAAVPVLPNYTFVTGDHGQHTFQVTFPTTGAQTLTATDTVTAAITGQASVNVEAVGSVTHFGLRSFGATIPGVATPFLLVALDANNHVVAGYTGTVHFTSSDTSAGLPGNYTFLPGDNGTKVISVTFNSVGNQTLTATDVNTASIVSTANIRVFARARFPWGWW